MSNSNKFNISWTIVILCNTRQFTQMSTPNTCIVLFDKCVCTEKPPVDSIIDIIKIVL
jgi:hypothetical protein